MKKADPSRPPAAKQFSILRALFALALGPGRPGLFFLLLVGLFVGAWYVAWRFYAGPHVLADPRYRITADDVEITPPPPWIHSDVRGEAIRGITLRGSMSVMDDKLTQRIADAFGLHPWVAKVVGVRKFHPSRVKVDLEYRRPVLMVEVPVPGGVGLLPVDVQGAWLPSGDFSPIEANGYPRLAGITSAPVGPMGTRWGDARVLGAAEIAAAIGPAWAALGLQRITAAVASVTNAGEEYTYEIATRHGRRILWGHSPGESNPGEVAAAEKVARLKQYAADHGDLDSPLGPQALDVRGLRRLEVKP
jgi:hypothetical protein